MTLASTSTFQTQVHRAFTGFVRFKEFVVRLTLSPRRHWHTLSSPFMLTDATRAGRVIKGHNCFMSWLFSVCWMQQLG